MTLELTIPEVYRQPSPRAASFPRLRTDVCGFVGFAGPRAVHRAERLDDWRDYVEAFLREDDGTVVPPPPGSRLADAVRVYFANGGARCYVVNLGPVPATADAARPALADMLGIERVPPPDVDGAPVRRTGLELLLEEVDEVSFVDLPDLFAHCPDPPPPPDEPLPPVFERGRFHPCPDRFTSDDVASPGASWPAPPCPLYDDGQILQAQRYVLDRVARAPWRALVLLSVPAGQTSTGAAAWRDELGREPIHWAALYWPWLRTQDRPGLPVRVVPPSSFAAGIIARRDLARGPHIAPANETVRAAVGVEESARGLDDVSHAAIYDQGVNVIRSFDGYGLQLWGARTLLWSPSAKPVSEPLAYVHNRRCLSAIERTAEQLGRRLVFEPNQAMLRLQLSHSILTYLLEVFQSGALAGETPEQAFRISCDETLNTRESIEQGRVICEIAVALAAPAEFIVFRVGRREGLVEIEEV